MNAKFSKATRLALSALILTALILTAGLYTADACAQATASVQSVDENELSAIIQANSTPVVVEFYDPTDPDTSGECARQKQVLEDVAAEYAGRVTFLRFDIRQDPAMAAAGRLVVCPTTLFILDRFPDPTQGNVPNRTPFRHWGLLTQSQFEELIGEFFNIKP